MSSKSKLPFVLGSIYDMYVDRSRYIEALCPRAWKVYGNESTVQTCVDQILTLQRDARAGVPLMVRSDRCMRLQRPISTPLLTHVLSALMLFLAPDSLITFGVETEQHKRHRGGPGVVLLQPRSVSDGRGTHLHHLTADFEPIPRGLLIVKRCKRHRRSIAISRAVCTGGRPGVGRCAI